MQTLIRQLLAAAGGALMLDTSNVSALVTGILLIGCASVWSLLTKLNWVKSIYSDKYISDTGGEFTRKVVAVLASQLTAALAGWLQMRGFGGDVNDPTAVALFSANYAASKMGWTLKAAGIKPKAVLLFAASAFLCGSLPSCSTQSQDAFQKRLRAAGESIATAVSISALEATLIPLRSELITLMSEPVDEDPAQQLSDQARIQALKEIIRLGEEQIVKLRTPSAKQPVNVAAPARAWGSPSSDLSAQIPKLGAQVAAHL